MGDANPTITVSPRISTLLTQVTKTPDLETALWDILSEYVDLKIKLLGERVRAFESKWRMSFKEFSKHCKSETLEQSSYAYEVESDFWEWEEAETLLRHYEVLKAKWM